MSPCFISVIISTYGRNECLCDVISYVVKEDYPAFELIVVDQLPQHSPATVKFLTDVRDKIRYFSVDFALLPRARNFGIKKAKGEILIFCDDDIIPKPGFIKQFVEAYKDDDIWGIAGEVLPPGKERYIGMSARKIKLAGLNVKGRFMSFRKKAIFEVGGYDEGYIGPALREESDIGARIIRKGGTILYKPEITCLHFSNSEGGCYALIHQREKFIIENNFRYAVRNLSLGWFLWWMPFIFRWCVLTRRNAKNLKFLIESILIYFKKLFWAILYRQEIKKETNYLRGDSER